jgi:hypothetical protein
MKLDTYEVFEIIGLDGLLILKNFPKWLKPKVLLFFLIQQLNMPSDAMKAQNFKGDYRSSKVGHV